MSSEVKAVGLLEYEAMDDLVDAEDALADTADAAVREVRAIVAAGAKRGRKRLTVQIGAALSEGAGRVFQDWLAHIAAAAAKGHVDTWQESFGEAAFVRIHAGGQVERIEQPFPAAAIPTPPSPL
jgi:hypothetical protein